MFVIHVGLFPIVTALAISKGERVILPLRPPIHHVYPIPSRNTFTLLGCVDCGSDMYFLAFPTEKDNSGLIC